MQRQPLDTLGRRIVGALQVDGRASWRRIADVLGEPDRTVARRGAALLEENDVSVVGLPAIAPSHLLQLRCRPSHVRSIARAIASWPHSVFVYALAESAGVVAELALPLDEVAALILDVVPHLDGVDTYQLTPVLQYFRTVAEWRPAVLSAAEVAALEVHGTPPEQSRPEEYLTEPDRTIVQALVDDGRTTFETIANLGGFSEATARRRIDQLIQRGVVRIRAVVEPALLGLPVESLLWITCKPGAAIDLGTTLAQSPYVRYAALIMGTATILADVTTPSMVELRELLTDHDAVGDAHSIRASLLLEAYKRGGVIVTNSDPLEPAPSSA